MAEQDIRSARPVCDQGHEDQAGPDCFDARRPTTLGQFLVIPDARLLVCNGDRLELGSRAFDLLMVLLQRRGQIVTKQEIMRYVWPSTNVEESNVRVQMACLRRALGKDGDLIKTIPGRGYVVVDDGVTEGPIVTPFKHSDGATGHLPLEAEPSLFTIDENLESREMLHHMLGQFHAYVQSFMSADVFSAAMRAAPIAGARHPRASFHFVRPSRARRTGGPNAARASHIGSRA